MLLFSVLFMASGGLAQEEVPAEPQAAPLTEEQAIITRREAAELAREQYAGRVLSVRFEEGGWRLRMEHEGTVFNVRVDARDGELRGPADED